MSSQQTSFTIELSTLPIPTLLTSNHYVLLALNGYFQRITWDAFAEQLYNDFVLPNLDTASLSGDHTQLSNIGTNTHAQIDTHIASTSNPHGVDASDVGNGTPQWNANQLQDVDVANTVPTAGDTLRYNGAAWEPSSSQADYATPIVTASDYAECTSYTEDTSTNPRTPREIPTAIKLEYYSAALTYVHSVYSAAELRTIQNKLQDAVSLLDFVDTESGPIEYFNPATNNRATATNFLPALRAAVKTGRSVYTPKPPDGRTMMLLYDGNGEVECITNGQIITNEGTGGYGYGDNDVALPDWQYNTSFTVCGTWPKKIRTRVLFRANAEADEDEARSCVFNIQADSVEFVNVHATLYCDYTDTTPTNLGDDCDDCFFQGTRFNTRYINVMVTGYFRDAGIYEDVTNGRGFPRFNDHEGNPFPSSSTPNGGDATYMNNVYIRGPRRAHVTQGALPKAGASDYGDQYFDALLNALIADSRGSFGRSDFTALLCRFYGVEHHSGRRVFDPTPIGGVLTEASMLAEPVTAPCVIYVSGLAGNSSNSIWNGTYYSCRFSSAEAFLIRLDRVSRLRFQNCHMERRGDTLTDTTGASINSNDFVATSYSMIAATANTSRVTLTGSNLQAVATDLRHYYGTELTLETDSGRRFYDNDAYIEVHNGSFDFRVNPKTPGDEELAVFRDSTDDSTKMLLEYEKLVFGANTGSCNIQALEGNIEARAELDHEFIARHSNIILARFGPTLSRTESPFRPVLVTLSTLPSAAALNGYTIIVEDAPDGQTLAISQGGAWINQGTGLPIATASTGTFTPTFEFLNNPPTTLTATGNYAATRDVVHFDIEMTWTGLDVTNSTSDGFDDSIFAVGYAALRALFAPRIPDSGGVTVKLENSDGVTFSASDPVHATLANSVGTPRVMLTDAAGTEYTYDSGKFAAAGTIKLSGWYIRS